MSKRKGMLLCMDMILALLLILLDQWTKQLAVIYLKGKDAIPLIKGILELDYLENRGAAFGMFQNQKIFLLAVGVVFLGGIGYLLIRLPDQKKYFWIHILASVVLAGGVGNMIDRIRLDYVVDFISFVLIHFPIFNVADCYVVTATFCIFFLLLFVYKDDDFSFLSRKNQASLPKEDRHTDL